MKVQCLIPKYNNGKYFEQTLLTLINQSFPYYSILISENHSTDGSEQLVDELCKKYKNVSYFIPKEAAKSFGENVGELIDRMDCNVDFVHIASSDDLWSVQFLEKMINFQNKNIKNNLSAIYSDRILIDENTRIIGATGNISTPPIISNNIEYESFTKMLEGCSYIIAGALFKTEIVKNLSNLARSTKNSFDWILMLECARKGDIGYLSSPIFQYRIHPFNTNKIKINHFDSLKLYSYYIQINDSEDEKAIKMLNCKININNKLELKESQNFIRDFINERLPIIKLYLHKFSIFNIIRALKFSNKKVV